MNYGRTNYKKGIDENVWGGQGDGGGVEKEFGITPDSNLISFQVHPQGGFIEMGKFSDWKGL